MHWVTNSRLIAKSVSFSSGWLGRLVEKIYVNSRTIRTESRKEFSILTSLTYAR